ncbi:MAG TPA: hypothetical protein VML19_20105 [Verrucomicrobiae bacterium]|nr:hypothetical protein [Verrucomicrobiae bacterium]
MRIFVVLLGITIAAASAPEEKGKSLQLSSLPAAVQKTIQDNLKGADIKSIGKEKEDGVEQYEVETRLNGKSRDFNVDIKGNLLVVEEASTIDAVPAAAKAAILKKVADGKITSIETVTKPGQASMYEAGYTAKNGKKHEFLVKADGTEVKD